MPPGVRTYLTVNTILYDNDLDVCRNIIDAARQAGISAIIASDIAAILYARQAGVEVHISTQANVSNIEAVRFYARWADVVVLARELCARPGRRHQPAIAEEGITGRRGVLCVSRCSATEHCAWPCRANAI